MIERHETNTEVPTVDPANPGLTPTEAAAEDLRVVKANRAADALMSILEDVADPRKCALIVDLLDFEGLNAKAGNRYGLDLEAFKGAVFAHYDKTLDCWYHNPDTGRETCLRNLRLSYFRLVYAAEGGQE